MIDRYPPIWRHRGVLPKHALGYMSSLFIVRVRTFRLGNGWVIAIYSNVLPKVQRSRSICPDSVAKWRQGTKVTLAPDAPFPYYCTDSLSLYPDSYMNCKFPQYFLVKRKSESGRKKQIRICIPPSTDAIENATRTTSVHEKQDISNVQEYVRQITSSRMHSACAPKIRLFIDRNRSSTTIHNIKQLLQKQLPSSSLRHVGVYVKAWIVERHRPDVRLMCYRASLLV